MKLAALSLVAGIIIISIKIYASLLSGSAALRSDALEGIVNIMASAFTLFAISYSLNPIDDDHPYGHGKMEFLSSAFEGGLVAIAALFMIADGTMAIYSQRQIEELNISLALNVFAGILNGLLGFLLLNQGRKLKSKA